VTFEEAVELIKRNSRRYAKRQATWFGRDKDIVWFNRGEEELIVKYIDAQFGESDINS
jgi:tRNA dimethylallyltransferase